ncbi:MAG TPA: type ISP restriction/modification enzyme [Pyrinomonadaceae bacterium]|nr:type ISP restriction/modification enzyme [Pyrinomonadaceae bacterium]
MPLTPEYLKQIGQALAAGNATEHTHRPALKSFVESFGRGIVATNEPKRVRYGAPDFVVTRGETPLGYIEAKDVGTPLEREEKGEQMSRYFELGNVVLTDYLEFRWYVNGVRRDAARLATKTKAGKLRAVPGGAERVEELLSSFFDAQAATVGSAKELAVRMARLARAIRKNIGRALEAEDPDDEKPDPLRDQLASFREVLLHELQPEQFADMYAQTICYGLFAARCNARRAAEFTRDGAARLVPKTNPFLQKTFYQMVGPELSPHVAWAVDDLVALLTHTDMAGILEDFGKRTRREDPVVHFYETFLAEYDPHLRETRGVYYTPEPVVSYIVRSVDHLLRNDFGLAEGLADARKIRTRGAEGAGGAETHKVLILDPATGTGTFLYSAIQHIYRAVGERARGAWPAYVARELLPRLFGFELLMAPYTVAHLKLGLLLQETGVDLEKLGAETEGEAGRLCVYLTNTLEEVHRLSDAPGMTRWLSEESDAASRVKQERPVMVVMGNPPYSGHSANTGQWIAHLLRGMDTQTGLSTSNFTRIAYRPFDVRYTYFTGTSRGFHCRPRGEVMRHMLRAQNLGLISARSNKSQTPDHFYCTRFISEAKCGEATTQSAIFPLYLAFIEGRQNLFDADEPTDAPGGRRANLSGKFVAEFAESLKMRFVADGKGDRRETFGPEDVFAYMYAVFHSPAYRTRYAEFLKIDFPRLPLTSDAELFRALCRAGDELIGLHLLERVNAAAANYPEGGTNEVEQVRYTAPGEGGATQGRVWINRAQFFEGVAPEVWDFHVGGYQVAAKWLKDRKGRRLTYEDVTHYLRVVAALAETLRLMSEIDAEIDRHGGWPLK